MIGALLPPEVRTAAVYGDVAGPPPYPEEAALVARAVGSRQAEFASTRRCAHEALRGLGEPPAPLLAGPRGDPRWAPGLVGSLTHCDGYRAAAVARSTDVAALGIDAEPDGALPDGVLGLVSLPRERSALPALSDATGLHADRLLFSAKESVFKAWYPVVRRELGFCEVRLSFEATGCFAAELLADGWPFPGPLRGRWLARRGLLVTVVLQPAERVPA